jgi:hypothetical protein
VGVTAGRHASPCLETWTWKLCRKILDDTAACRNCVRAREGINKRFVVSHVPDQA